MTATEQTATEQTATEHTADLTARAAAFGLGVLGAFNTEPGDGAPPGVAAVALLGYDGPGLWRAFSAGPEYADGDPDPLDRWSRRVGDQLAAALSAEAFYPFGGAPHWPFLRWAARAEALWPSPLGMAISAKRGLWSGYRVALGFREPLAGLPPVAPGAAPCARCAEKPCLSACPVGAFGESGYDIAACAAHLSTDAGADCMAMGCRARRACPVGQAYAPEPAQAAFHMQAFLAARSPS